jgi:allantoate deiminase
MKQAGMTVRQDQIGNLIGHYPSKLLSAESPKIFLLGSHLDTVRDAGKFDGALGVLVALACVQRLRDGRERLPFALEVIGFADEEGLRYQSAYLGSKALAGTFESRDLKRKDINGVTMAQAIRGFGGKPDALAKARLSPDRLLGYAEVHIEQGPVLEQKNLPVGIVAAIAGQTRATLVFTGRSGHAGTTPMKSRRDALCAASEFVLAVEALAKRRAGLVATVGELAAAPGASNVIPGQARLSLDVRHAQDTRRLDAVSWLRAGALAIASRRGIRLDWQAAHETSAILCDQRVSGLLARAARPHVSELISLPSGAGHDAVAMAAIAPVAMLFVRCKRGISHHPEESASERDVRVAIAVINDFLQLLGRTVEFQ